jgi:hypothetical protein
LIRESNAYARVGERRLVASLSESQLLQALADGQWHAAEELAAGTPLREPGVAEYVRLLNEPGRRIEERELEGRHEYRLARS